VVEGLAGEEVEEEELAELQAEPVAVAEPAAEPEPEVRGQLLTGLRRMGPSMTRGDELIDLFGACQFRVIAGQLAATDQPCL
jgi:hypothetical protein